MVYFWSARVVIEREPREKKRTFAAHFCYSLATSCSQLSRHPGIRIGLLHIWHLDQMAVITVFKMATIFLFFIIPIFLKSISRHILQYKHDNEFIQNARTSRKINMCVRSVAHEYCGRHDSFQNGGIFYRNRTLESLIKPKRVHQIGSALACFKYIYCTNVPPNTNDLPQLERAQ